MLTILSFHFKCTEDLDELFDTIDQQKPDVVTLQNFLSSMRDVGIRKFKEKGYTYVRSSSAFSRDATEVIFFISPKGDVTNLACHTFFTKTSQGSSFTKNTIVINGINVDIVTSRLDDGGENNVARKSQLAQLFFSTKTNPRTIITATTHMKKWQESTQDVPDGFRDGWSEMGTSDNRATLDNDRASSVFYGTGVECEFFDTIEILDLNYCIVVKFRVL